MVRFSPLRLVQTGLVLTIMGTIYVRFGDDSDSPPRAVPEYLKAGHDGAHVADAPDNPHPDGHVEAKQEYPQPNEEEIQAARQKRLDAEHQKEADKAHGERLVKAERLDPFYETPALPAGWEHGDWSGLPAGTDLSTKSEDEIRAASIKRYAFNAHQSARIPLRRPLRDMRTSQCSSQMYPPVTELPTVSVIICFAEEMWSSLFRTVWSVLDRTPRNLLLEVILVNDNSTAAWLGTDLDTYMQRLPPIVKMVNTNNRSGLIRSRTVGANVAKGDILVFLDSHCEASDGWYEPIAARIKESRTTIVCPTIDAISDQNMVYNAGGGMAIGGFHWTLDFTWIYRPLEQGKTIADPLVSPTMAGGLFAVEREYWYELGGYDLAMGGWGGENLELSFRVWTCGGSMEIHPCSHVGHIFRSAHPYAVPGGFGEVYTRNSARLAAVWMDEYADIYFHVRPSAQKSNYGDVSDRLAMRKRMGCQPFKWYLDKFFKDKFIPTAEVSKHEGQFRNGANRCIDKLGHQHPGETLGMYGCHPESTPSLMQSFIFTHTGQIRTIWDLCWDAGTYGGGAATDASATEPVHLSSCAATDVWRYEEATKHIVHVRTNKCMDSLGDALVVAVCDPAGRAEQQWTFSGHLNC
eukprot:m.1084952 g.1084952  ORF g.1084952 m.1084952 type:complete len:634 (+) comp24277_c0_seq1:348-2249(+)